MMLSLFYAALSVFLIGNLVRFVRILRMPAHLRWELYPIPRGPRERARYGGSYMEETDWWTRSMRVESSGELGFILREIFLFKGVWDHNRPLWIWSWLLHQAFFLLLGTIGLAILAAILDINILSETIPKGSISIAALSGLVRICSWLFTLCGVAGSAGLIVLRLASSRLRPFTSRAFLLNLFVILAIFTTGLLSLLWNPETPLDMIAFTKALLLRHPALILPQLEAAHLSLLAIFLLYFPFTHMTHLYMKYFTFHSVRWDDQPLHQNPAMEASMVRSLNSGVSWAAPHIHGDGKKSWSEIAAEGIVDDPSKTER
jgi:nitrate reductase gamma subunit